jgi:hypothetical protein
MTLAQVRDDLLSKLGVVLATADSQALQDTATAINGAMQILETAGQDYFTRQKITISVVANQQVYPLAQTVQNVLGPIRLNDTTPLRSLASRGELDQFDRIFQGLADFGAQGGVPLAYWVESLNSGLGLPDPDLINVWLAPTPTVGGTLAIEVVDQAPSYSVFDVTMGTAVLPVAQGYDESCVLPIARHLITRSAEFSRPDLTPRLKDDFDMALQRLGLLGGFPNAVQPAPDRKSSG